MNAGYFAGIFASRPKALILIGRLVGIRVGPKGQAIVDGGNAPGTWPQFTPALEGPLLPQG